MSEIVRHTLNAALASGGTITLAYPAGKTASSFSPIGHKLHVRDRMTFYAAPTGFTLTFGVSNITLTWAGPTLARGDKLVIELFDAQDAGDDIKIDLGYGAGPVALDEHLRVGGLNVKDFGAKGDGVTNDQAAIAAALTYAASLNVPTSIYFPKGDYVVNTTRLIPPDNCRIYGDGIGVTRFLWDEVDHLFALTTGGRYESLTFEDFSIVGSWSPSNAVMGTQVPIFIYVTDNLRVHKVRVEKCRYFGITARDCKYVSYTNCEISEVYRDGLTAASCSYINICDNIIDHCDDDAIVASVFNDTGSTAQNSVVIANNRISDAQGIRAHGGKRIAITGNQIERCRLLGIHVGHEDVEGNTGRVAVTITGNTITDIFNRNGIDTLSNAGDYIILQAIRQAGGEAAIPGNNVTSTGAIVAPYGLVDNNGNGSGVAQVGAWWNVISGNVCTRTLGTATNYSDYGHGQMFTRNGYIDPAITTAEIAAGRGLRMNNVRNTLITSNVFNGVAECILFGLGTNHRFENVLIANNIFSDFATYGISFSNSVSNTLNIVVADNIFDGDPFFRSSNRRIVSELPTGGWSADTVPAAIFVNAATGLTFSGNTIKNVARVTDQIASGATTRVLWFRNILECDPDTTLYSNTNKGVGNTPRAGEKFIYRIVDSDPTSATYGTQLGLNYMDSDAIPTTGKWVRGHFVKNNGYAVATGKVLLGWARLTTGSNNVDGTDWSPVFGTTS